MREKLIVTWSLVLLSGPMGRTAADVSISRWVDEQGVTHFTNSQFAPASASSVDIQRTNRMDVPTGSTAVSNGKTSTGPVFSKISLPPKKNPKGWRSRNESVYTGRKHQTNHRR